MAQAKTDQEATTLQLGQDREAAQAREHQRDEDRKVERQADHDRRVEDTRWYKANIERQEQARKTHKATMMAFMSSLASRSS